MPYRIPIVSQIRTSRMHNRCTSENSNLLGNKVNKGKKKGLGRYAPTRVM